MARPTTDSGPTLVVVNPDEDCSPAACREILDEVLAQVGEPLIISVDAAEVVRKIRYPES
jgi:hypothetical protein